jgi:hypothetical protein
MKKIIWSIITISTIIFINWRLTILLNAAFMDYAFITGIGAVTIIWFFNSTGGTTSNSIRLQTQSQTGIKVDEEKKAFNPSVVFFSSVIYTAIALIATVFYYKDYFIS